MTPTEFLNQAETYAAENLLTLAKELAEKESTGIWPEGQMHNLVKILKNVSTHSASNLAESIVRSAALKQFIAMKTAQG